MLDAAQTDARIEALQAVIARLEDRVAELEAAMGFGFLTPLEWGLTGQMMRLFGCLMARELMTREAALAALYADRHGAEETPSVKTVDVQICKMRARLSPFGIAIQKRWGQGYFLTAETKARVREQLAEAAA